MTTSAKMFDALRAGGEKWRATRSRGPDASVANREKYHFAFRVNA